MPIYSEKKSIFGNNEGKFLKKREKNISPNVEFKACYLLSPLLPFQQGFG